MLEFFLHLSQGHSVLLVGGLIFDSKLVQLGLDVCVRIAIDIAGDVALQTGKSLIPPDIAL